MFSYAVFLIPILLKQIGDLIFILSGILSLGLIALFVLLLRVISPARVRQGKRAIVFSVGTIYIVFNTFYFLNIIPPIPLSLKESGVYHYIARTPGGEYETSYEKAPWYLFFEKTDNVFRWKQGEAAYFFSSVFAPANLKATILHQWERYDSEKKEWIKLSKELEH